ncbi:uncharacterized protein LOC125656079 isoform X2 [Ostrea edulis]|uniref:uncharacterized protein LOC125656079 isoform X2 n=1 Tax=Ostrea edulis TaxID=37623 RepID=UPI0024AF3F02|nr:uncharacterized protein LOC125656079 isoform X2 [Ostrea edulis]
MIRFGFLILTLSVCWEFVSTQKPCDGVLGQQFRPDPTDCRVYYLCGQGKDWRLQCGPNMIWNQEKGACVFSTPKDTCTQNIKNPLPPKPPQGDPNARSPGSRHYSPFSESTWRPKCRPGSTKRFPHPTRCAQYYDCGADPKEDWWGKHLRECRYPTVYDTKTGSCEYYTTVNCGKRKMPLDPCDYLSNACRNAHCAPCHIRYATCTGLPDGINVWRGREKTPFYVVCQKERVAFHGRCINTEPGKRQVYDGEYHTCGRPIDFEMGMVHHMHRGEIGKSQIVEQIHHAKRVQQSQQFKAPQHSKSPSNPVQKNKQNNTNNNAGKKQTQQGNKKHINQPKKNQTPQQNVKVQNANNNQPQNQPNTPKPHINQPQQKAASSQKKAVQKQPNSHAPHVNQPKIPPPQGNTQSPSKNTIHPNQAQPQTPGQSARHANKPQTQAPVQNSPPSRQQYQSPPQSQKPPQHPPNTFKPSSQPQQHNPPQRPLQNHAPPNNQHPSQQYSHPNRQHNSPQPPPQNYGPPNRSPQPQYPQHQRPGSNIATQPHVNQPPASTQQQGPPYSHPPNQNKVPAQTPTSLQTFIGEMQNKFMNQQPNVPQPHVYPNHPNQPLHNAPSQHPSANNPPVPYQQTVRAKPGRRPQRTHNTPPVQPVQPLPRQPVVHQRAPVVHQPLPVVHQPAPTRQVSYPHPNQQRQPSYPQAPQVKPLPPVPQRPPTVPRNPRPPQNVRRTVQNPNIPRTSPYHNSQPSYPIPNKNHSPPQPTPTQSRAYPQPLPRARNHGPQPVQRPRIGPYPKPQLYNEPSTTRQAIGRKNLSRRRHPKPTNQGTKKRRVPPRRVPKRRV